MVSFDCRGDPYRSFDGAYALYDGPGRRGMDGALPYWSWTHWHVFDSQTGRMSRLEQVRTISGGHTTSVDDLSIYDRYLTNVALMRLGDS
jgi:hypothetical protein